MKIPFYFDYACPWAYLASCRAESYFRDLGVEIDFRPIRLADLTEIKGQKGLPPGENDAPSPQSARNRSASGGSA